jgi:transposase InsO family protein
LASAAIRHGVEPENMSGPVVFHRWIAPDLRRNRALRRRLRSGTIGSVTSTAPLQFVILLVARWLGRSQAEAIEYPRAETRPCTPFFHPSSSASRPASPRAPARQLAALRRARPRPRLRPIDRAFWILVSRAWSRWAETLAIVRPETVVAWHRRGFAQFWRWRSQRVGRPPLAAEVVALIEQMAWENPLWSRRRIASELAKLGHAVDKNTVARYIPKPSNRPRCPPTQTWGTFLRNDLGGTLAVDFLTVPTVTFGVLYVFFVLSLERRRVLHVNVTAHPSAAWTAQQMVEALGPDAPPVQRLIRDRDAIFGKEFDSRVTNLGLHQILTAPRSPWQNGYAERFVGTVRRELLDHVVVLGERHLLRLVRDHAAYYNADRPHMSLNRDAPLTRAVEPPSAGAIVALPRIGGLHHRYVRAA